jgi:hypothetical protein
MPTEKTNVHDLALINVILSVICYRHSQINSHICPARFSSYRLAESGKVPATQKHSKTFLCFFIQQQPGMQQQGMAQGLQQQVRTTFDSGKK